MSDINFQMTANDADVTKALQNLVKENAKLREEIAKGVQQSKDEAKAAKEAAEAQKAHSAAMKEAEAVVNKNLTASQKYAKEVARLNELRDKGVLSARDHAKAIEAEQSKLGKSSESVERFQGAWQKFAVVGAASVGILGQAADQVARLRREMEDSAIQIDDLSRRFGIQGGLSEKERNVQTGMVGKTALEAAVPIGKAFQVATQLSSSGFQDPVKNGTLNTALALMQSSNQIDGDVGGFVKGSGQFLQAFGLQKNQQNLSELGVRMQGLFKSTDVQAADLTEFAKAAPVLAGSKMGMGESLSVLTALRETMNAGEAATGARNVVSIMQASGKNETATKALASIGLRPDQVDIQGEGLKTALERLKASTQNLGEAEQAGVLTQIFGRENVAPARILMNSTGRFGDFMKMQQEAAPQFVRDVGTARSGMAAQSVRAQVQDQLDSFANADALERQQLVRDARVNVRNRDIKNQAAKGGAWNSFWAGSRAITGAIEDNAIRPLFGESETPLGAMHAREMERLANRGPNAAPFVPNLPPAMLNQKQLEELMKEQNQLLREQNQLMKDGKNQGAAVGRANQREGAGT